MKSISLLFYALFVISFQLWSEKGKNKKIKFETDVLPLFENYCYRCHADGEKKGEVSLDFGVAGVELLKDVGLWKRVWENVYRHNMPPADKPQCNDSELSTILDWIEGEVFQTDGKKEDPGRVTIRRLNRTEYKNTIRDLFGIQIETENFFPPDDTGYGFDTIGEVLSLSPILMEKYMEMAENILTHAFGPTENSYHLQTFSKQEMKGGKTFGEFRVLPTTGKIQVNVQIPHSGKFIFYVEAGASRAGNELARMAIELDGQLIESVKIDAEYPTVQKYIFELECAEQGEVSFAMLFTNDFYDPKNSNSRFRDRNLFIQKLTVNGVREPEQKHKNNRLKLLDGIYDNDFDNQSVEQTLKTMLPKIFRRAIPPSELNRHMKLFYQIKEQDNSSFLALRLVIKAALVSPHFLFREEFQPNSNDSESIHQLDAFALASRLSYFLWSSTPDDRLMKLARENTLFSNLESEVLRMISDEKSDGFIKNFTGQWLQIRDLDLIEPDRKRFPSFSAELRESMRHETESFFAYILRGNRTVFDFIKSEYTFVNQSMAQFYELSGRFGNKFEKVNLPNGQLVQSGGFLTQASILAITSNATRTSPVKRGRWVLDNILGAPPKDPPPGITDLEDFENHNSASLSLREQMAIHSKNSSCSSCHASMDAMGYTMENFDAIGKWRDSENGRPVNSNGRLGSGEEFNGVEDLKTFIVQKKADAFLNCLAEKLLTYGIGRGMDYYDRKAIKDIVNKTKLKGSGFADLVIHVVQSKPFLLRRGG